MSKDFCLHSAKWMAVVVTCCLWLLVSCGSPSRTNAPAIPTLKSVTLSSASATVDFGSSQQFTAVGNYSDGSSKPLSGVTWATSDARLATVNSTGFASAFNPGHVTVSATSGTITANATLTIGPLIATEGRIPGDFNLANAMRSLYGNYDPSTQASVSPLLPGSEENSFFQRAKQIEVRPFFTATADDSGISKILFGTYSGPFAEGFTCHGCAPLIGMAVFIHTGEGWVIESSTKSAVFSGQWGHPPDAHIVQISSDHVGVRLDGPGAFATYVSILVPWNGEIREAFGTNIAEGNGAVCGDEEGMQPCVGTQRKITFVKGANPSYDDIVLMLSGTAVSEKPPFKVVEVNGTERSTFSGGKYVRVSH
jgi:hypothetical protein